MKTKLTRASIATVTRLITNEFHKAPDTILGDMEREKLIKTAREFQLFSLAAELEQINNF